MPLRPPSGRVMTAAKDFLPCFYFCRQCLFCFIYSIARSKRELRFIRWLHEFWAVSTEAQMENFYPIGTNIFR